MAFDFYFQLYMLALFTVTGSMSQRCVDYSYTVTQGRSTCSNEIIFQDDFNDLNRNVWKHKLRISGREEQEFVTYNDKPQNSYVKDGILHILPTLLDDSQVTDGSIYLEGCEIVDSPADCYQKSIRYNIIPPVQSAEIYTMPFSFKFGTLEVRAKMPSGDWIVPYIKLKPKTNRNEKLNVTFLVAKSHGNENLRCAKKDYGKKNIIQGVSGSSSQYCSHDPYIRDFSRNISEFFCAYLHSTLRYGQGFDERYHTYFFQWSPGIDGKADVVTFNVPSVRQEKTRFALVFKERNSFILLKPDEIIPERKGEEPEAFKREFYISIGVFVGGMREFRDDVINNGKPKPWSNTKYSKARLHFWDDRKNWYPTWKGEEAALKIDYVKVTAL